MAPLFAAGHQMKSSKTWRWIVQEIVFIKKCFTQGRRWRITVVKCFHHSSVPAVPLHLNWLNNLGNKGHLSVRRKTAFVTLIWWKEQSVHMDSSPRWEQWILVPSRHCELDLNSFKTHWKVRFNARQMTDYEKSILLLQVQVCFYISFCALFK